MLGLWQVWNSNAVKDEFMGQVVLSGSVDDTSNPQRLRLRKRGRLMADEMPGSITLRIVTSTQLTSMWPGLWPEERLNPLQGGSRRRDHRGTRRVASSTLLEHLDLFDRVCEPPSCIINWTLGNYVMSRDTTNVNSCCFLQNVQAFELIVTSKNVFVWLMRHFLYWRFTICKDSDVPQETGGVICLTVHIIVNITQKTFHIYDPLKTKCISCLFSSCHLVFISSHNKGNAKPWLVWRILRISTSMECVSLEAVERNCVCGGGGVYFTLPVLIAILESERKLNFQIKHQMLKKSF